MDKFLLDPKRQILDNPRILYNYPLGELFAIFGLKSQNEYGYPISLWANVNKENWVLVEEICDKYLLMDPENLLTIEIITEIYAFSPESPAKQTLITVMKWLLACAATVEALRLKEIKMEIKNSQCFVKKGIERTNMRDALWTAKKILISDAQKYCLKARKYLLLDYQKQIRTLALEAGCTEFAIPVGINIISPSSTDVPSFFVDIEH